MTMRRMRIACWMPKDRNTLFSTATIVARTHLSGICTLAAWFYIKALDVSRFCFCSCFPVLGLKLLTLLLRCGHFLMPATIIHQSSLQVILVSIPGSLFLAVSVLL